VFSAEQHRPVGRVFYDGIECSGRNANGIEHAGGGRRRYVRCHRGGTFRSLGLPTGTRGRSQSTHLHHNAFFLQEAEAQHRRREPSISR